MRRMLEGAVRAGAAGSIALLLAAGCSKTSMSRGGGSADAPTASSTAKAAEDEAFSKPVPAQSVILDASGHPVSSPAPAPVAAAPMPSATPPTLMPATPQNAAGSTYASRGPAAPKAGQAELILGRKATVKDPGVEVIMGRKARAKPEPEVIRGKSAVHPPS